MRSVEQIKELFVEGLNDIEDRNEIVVVEGVEIQLGKRYGFYAVEGKVAPFIGRVIKVKPHGDGFEVQYLSDEALPLSAYTRGSNEWGEWRRKPEHVRGRNAYTR